MVKLIAGMPLVTMLMITGVYGAKSAEVDWRSPGMAYGFYGPSVYGAPPTYYYTPPTYYAPPPVYVTPPGYENPGYWRHGHHDDDNDDQGDND